MTQYEIKNLYEKYVCMESSKFKGFRLSDETMQKINENAHKRAESKLNETHHIVDNRKEIKRITTGIKGEYAVGRLLNIDVVDWSVGNSNDYNYPDIPGYTVGVKTSVKWNFPVIYKNNKYPQIFCIVNDIHENYVYVCGLATPDVLNKYQTDELILDENLRNRGTKTCFYGFDKLVPVSTLNDIEKYRKAEF